jgi:hypothetical protein
MKPRSIIALAALGPLLSSCGGSGGGARQLAREALADFKARPQFLLSGQSREADAQFQLHDGDASAGCPYANIKPRIPSSFTATKGSGVPQHGCTQEQTSPDYEGMYHGLNCEIHILPTPKTFHILTFCGSATTTP